MHHTLLLPLLLLIVSSEVARAQAAPWPPDFYHPELRKNRTVGPPNAVINATVFCAFGQGGTRQEALDSARSSTRAMGQELRNVHEGASLLGVPLSVVNAPSAGELTLNAKVVQMPNGRFEACVQVGFPVAWLQPPSPLPSVDVADFGKWHSEAMALIQRLRHEDVAFGAKAAVDILAEPRTPMASFVQVADLFTAYPRFREHVLQRALLRARAKTLAGDVAEIGLLLLQLQEEQGRCDAAVATVDEILECLPLEDPRTGSLKQRRQRLAAGVKPAPPNPAGPGDQLFKAAQFAAAAKSYSEAWSEVLLKQQGLAKADQYDILSNLKQREALALFAGADTHTYQRAITMLYGAITDAPRPLARVDLLGLMSRESLEHCINAIIEWAEEDNGAWVVLALVELSSGRLAHARQRLRNCSAGDEIANYVRGQLSR